MIANNVYEHICYNEINTKTVNFVWKIRDFSERTQKVTSPQFPISAPENIGQWRLELVPNDRDRHSLNQFISISLNQTAATVSLAEVIFSLIDDKGAVAKQEVKEYNANNPSFNTRLADRDFVFNRDNDVLPDDELTVVCEFEIKVSANRFQRFLPAKLQRPPCRLAEDWGKLLASKSLTDVTIVVGEAELRAHKAVLAARSPVFAAMFTNHMLEKETSVVEITDMDADVVQAMLEFIYTGKEITQTSRAHNLLAAASKYQLDRLKFMCEEVLCEPLSLDNVLENLALADLYNASMLKEQCISFVMKRKAEILGSPSWDTFKRSHQSLVTDILEKICLHE